eukprot:gene3222-63529_t
MLGGAHGPRRAGDGAYLVAPDAREEGRALAGSAAVGIRSAPYLTDRGADPGSVRVDGAGDVATHTDPPPADFVYVAAETRLRVAAKTGAAYQGAAGAWEPLRLIRRNVRWAKRQAAFRVGRVQQRWLAPLHSRRQPLLPAPADADTELVTALLLPAQPRDAAAPPLLGPRMGADRCGAVSAPPADGAGVSPPPRLAGGTSLDDDPVMVLFERKMRERGL